MIVPHFFLKKLHLFPAILNKEYMSSSFIVEYYIFMFETFLSILLSISVKLTAPIVNRSSDDLF
jgi:hypothetical protein